MPSQAAEERLVAIVESLSVRETAKVLEYRRQSVDGPAASIRRSSWLVVGCRCRRPWVGMRESRRVAHRHCTRGLRDLLNAFMPPPRPDDARTPRQRRHDALEDLSRAWLDHGDTPVVGGEKPHISVIADIPALQGIAGGLHETLNGYILDVDTIRKLACDCSVSRIVLGPDSEVLDIGRKTRVWTAAQRRAIIARDRHCPWRGCEIRPEWCDIHHVDPLGGRRSLPAWRTESSSAASTTLCEHLEERRRRRMRN